MEKWVISLGGSRIIPKEIDFKFLKKFKQLLYKFPEKKFIVVTGGGKTARVYMKALKELKKGDKEQSKTGIAITRLHAKFLMKIFGEKANHYLPKNMKKIKNLLLKNQVVFCGALKTKGKRTSDGTAADIASYFNCEFINFTNVEGLYTKNPKKYKSAKKIKKISWKDFYEITKKIKFKAGQHFVLDQDAAKKIKENKIPTYITNSLEEVDKIIQGKKFKGTLIIK